MFCAIATTIERCKMEEVVDVFQVVKALRVQKPGAVLNVVSTQHSWFHIHWHSGLIKLTWQGSKHAVHLRIAIGWVGRTCEKSLWALNLVPMVVHAYCMVAIGVGVTVKPAPKLLLHLQNGSEYL